MKHSELQFEEKQAKKKIYEIEKEVEQQVNSFQKDLEILARKQKIKRIFIEFEEESTVFTLRVVFKKHSEAEA